MYSGSLTTLYYLFSLFETLKLRIGQILFQGIRNHLQSHRQTHPPQFIHALRHALSNFWFPSGSTSKDRAPGPGVDRILFRVDVLPRPGIKNCSSSPSLSSTSLSLSPSPSPSSASTSSGSEIDSNPRLSSQSDGHIGGSSCIANIILNLFDICDSSP